MHERSVIGRYDVTRVLSLPDLRIGMMIPCFQLAGS